jgi:lipopolysaccharide export system protein LptA
MEGEAETIEYDGRADTVRFLQRAELRRYLGTTLSDEMSGVVIVYDNTTSVLTVDGGPAKAMPDGTAPRVRAVLAPRSAEGRAAPAAVPASAPALRRSATVGVQK